MSAVVGKADISDACSNVAYEPKADNGFLALAYESKSSQSKTDGVYLERRDYRSPVHHSKGREKLNAVGCKLGGSVIVVNSKKGKGHTLKLNDCFGGWISGYRSRRLTGPSPSRVLSPCRWLGS